MHASFWEDRVPVDARTTLRAKYAILCRHACMVLTPCCHKEDYTHLPAFNPVRKPSDPIVLLPSQVENFKNLCKKFCRHKLEPRAVQDYAFGTFGKEKGMVVMNELAIPRIQDPERRATLLLSLMYFRPNTKTRCCGCKFCFNCKCLGHHDSCAEEFDKDNDLVRCRSCRILLLKVQGCDQVVCACGFSMSWYREQTLRRERRKGLVPVDIFDLALTDYWIEFRYKQSNVNKLIWLQKHVIAARRLLRPVFAEYVWRFRFSKILATQLRTAWETKRARYVDQTAASLRDILRPTLSSFIWRQRFTKTIPSMESELFWKAYYRWHSSDFDSEAEEMNTIFNIGVYDEE